MARIPFSQRVGVVSKPHLGREEMSEHLRIGLWNTFEPWLFSHDLSGLPYEIQARFVYTHLHFPTDEIPGKNYYATEQVKRWFLHAKWYEIYEFVDWLADIFSHARPEGHYVRADQVGRTLNRHAMAYIQSLNSALERDGSPYRFLNGELTPITSEVELAEVARAIQSPFSNAAAHIAQATTLLSMKPEPDYRNCIKESVSAVENVLKEATGLNMNNLSALLAEFEKRNRTAFHPAFREAVSKLYGWTSGDSGIRHAIFGDVNVDHADARFMLVTYSAFVNFLVQHVSGLTP